MQPLRSLEWVGVRGADEPLDGAPGWRLRDTLWVLAVASGWTAAFLVHAWIAAWLVG